MTQKPNPPKTHDAIDYILMVIGCAAAIGLAVIAGTSVSKTWIKKPPTVTPTKTPAFPTAALIHSPPPKTTSIPTPTTEVQKYILPFSNTRTVKTTDLTGLSAWELKVARNEIYARHGRPFVHKDLTCYFSKQSWYLVDPQYSDSRLTKLETANAKFILDYEVSINSPLVAKDSGCK